MLISVCKQLAIDWIYGHLPCFDGLHYLESVINCCFVYNYHLRKVSVIAFVFFNEQFENASHFSFLEEQL